ncbi:hypothetical protein [uncultured Helicobacter sp.]|uniref:hypothetical protein n=1 Tax=uncultured Helicobacter sp. TaxID=175537 RepID=UPI00374F5B0E
MQVLCNKTCYLGNGSKAPLPPLCEHTLFWRDSVVFGVNVSGTPLGLAFFLSIRLDSIISLQFACGKLVSLGWSESSLTPLTRPHKTQI